jgi:hypothetical protein
MAHIGAVRDPQQCLEKQALIDQIRSSISLIMSIHNQELEDAIEGGSRTAEWYADRLREARESRILLIETLGRHVSEHGC